MDFGDISGNIPIIALVIGLILLQFFLKRRRSPETKPREIAQIMLSEARLNLRLAEVFTFSHRASKFITASWQINKNKLDFLDQSLQVALSDAFMMAEDFNQRIATAKKYKSTSYMAGIDVDKLKRILAKSLEGLEEWLQEETETTEPPLKIPGIFGDWTGKG